LDGFASFDADVDNSAAPMVFSTITLDLATRILLHTLMLLQR